MNETTELLTADELADRLRVRPATIRLWSRRGRITRIRISGKVIRFDVLAVIEALQTNQSTAASEVAAAPVT